MSRRDVTYNYITRIIYSLDSRVYHISAKKISMNFILPHNYINERKNLHECQMTNIFNVIDITTFCFEKKKNVSEKIVISYYINLANQLLTLEDR